MEPGVISQRPVERGYARYYRGGGARGEGRGGEGRGAFVKSA